jgi:hypothetical protein
MNSFALSRTVSAVPSIQVGSSGLGTCGQNSGTRDASPMMRVTSLKL